MAKQERRSTAAVEPGKKFTPLISDDTMRSLYARTALFASPSETGREALLAALTNDLRPADTIVAASADPLLLALARLSGRGPAAPRSKPAACGSKAAAQPRVLSEDDTGARLSLAADTAFSLKPADGNIVVVFADASAASPPTARVAFGFAGAAHLPMLFVLESRDDESGAEIRSAAQGAAALGSFTAALGFPSITVDGGDTVALYRVAFESMKRARAGGGPTLIDARHRAAAGTGSPGAGSDQQPLAQLERHLVARGIQPPIAGSPRSRLASRQSPARALVLARYASP